MFFIKRKQVEIFLAKIICYEDSHTANMHVK